jgi:hypothetical protein
MELNRVHAILIILVLAFIYSFYIATRNDLPNFLVKANHGCIYGCETCEQYTLKRGASYIIEDIEAKEKKKLDNCLFTAWNFSHFIMYAVITTIAPEYYVEFAAMGVGFEIYECWRYQCDDYMDFVANCMGIGTGLLINQTFIKQ